MGRFLTGYGDAGYDHEGYAAQVLDDGTLTSGYSADTEPRMIGQVIAVCGCGWTGTTRYPCPTPFDEATHDLALAEWEHSHARPVLERAQNRDLTRLRQLLGDLAVGVELSDTAPRQALAEQLAHTVGRLRAASELARQLHQQLEREAW
jgi:hypothetical protein